MRHDAMHDVLDKARRRVVTLALETLESIWEPMKHDVIVDWDQYDSARNRTLRLIEECLYGKPGLPNTVVQAVGHAIDCVILDTTTAYERAYELRNPKRIMIYGDPMWRMTERRHMRLYLDDSGYTEWVKQFYQHGRR